MKGDGWFIMAGTKKDGTEFDVWREMNPGVPPAHADTAPEDRLKVTFKKPDVASTWYPGQRWRKFLMNLRQKKHKKYRLYLGRWICRTYNRGRDREDQLDTFHWLYLTESTLLHGKTKPTRCITLWRHFCSDGAKRRGHKPTYEAKCKTYKKPTPKKKDGEKTTTADKTAATAATTDTTGSK